MFLMGALVGAILFPLTFLLKNAKNPHIVSQGISTQLEYQARDEIEGLYAKACSGSKLKSSSGKVIL